MSRTSNTDPYKVQLAKGKPEHAAVSQRDLYCVSKTRKQENRAARARDRQKLRTGRYDDLPSRTIHGKNAAWLTW